MRDARLVTKELPLSKGEEKAYRYVTKAMMRNKWQPIAYTELCEAITNTTIEECPAVKVRTAKNYIKQMRTVGYLLQDEKGLYYTTGRMRRYVITVFG